jgi:hypothetical protein
VRKYSLIVVFLLMSLITQAQSFDTLFTPCHTQGVVVVPEATAEATLEAAPTPTLTAYRWADANGLMHFIGYVDNAGSDVSWLRLDFNLEDRRFSREELLPVLGEQKVVYVGGLDAEYMPSVVSANWSPHADRTGSVEIEVTLTDLPKVTSAEVGSEFLSKFEYFDAENQTIACNTIERRDGAEPDLVGPYYEAVFTLVSFTQMNNEVIFSQVISFEGLDAMLSWQGVVLPAPMVGALLIDLERDGEYDEIYPLFAVQTVVAE